MGEALGSALDPNAFFEQTMDVLAGVPLHFSSTAFCYSPPGDTVPLAEWVAIRTAISA